MLKDAVITETSMDKNTLTVGRAAGNDIMVDNLAVSSFHAKIVNNNGVFTLEDLNSTNGTYVNDRRISRINLSNNDAIMIGKHTLLFSDPRIEDDPDATKKASDLISEKTVLISTRAVTADAAAGDAASAKEPSSFMLVVIEGPTEKRENLLAGRLVTIGKASTAEIRLKGFFAPREAALVSKGKDGYYLSPPTNGRKVYVNGKTIEGRVLLTHGDIVEVWKVKMQYQVQE
jgi:pSer/pThr/pTyr-binding forkhead associated (FHA) protein